MFGIERVAKALTLRSPRSSSSMSAPASFAAPTSAGAPGASGLTALARLAWVQVSTLPGAALAVPDLLRAVAERALAIPASRRRPPSPSFTLRVLSKVVRADDDMREAYLSLLTAAADSAFADVVHPAFVEVLSQLHRDELRIIRSLESEGPYPVVSVSSRLQHGGGSRVELRHFSLLGERAHCRHPERTPAYLDNLARLGLIEIRPTRVTDDVRVFQDLENHPTVLAVRATIEQQPAVRIGPLSEPIVADVGYKSLSMTSFGRQFRDVCSYRADSRPATWSARDESLAAR